MCRKVFWTLKYHRRWMLNFPFPSGLPVSQTDEDNTIIYNSARSKTETDRRWNMYAIPLKHNGHVIFLQGTSRFASYYFFNNVYGAGILLLLSWN